MSSPTVVDVVISGTTATVVDTRVDGITTVEGTPQVTNVSGQIPDLGVTTNYLAGQGEILSLTNDIANLRANVIITGQTLTDEIGVLSGVLISTGNYLESNILTLSGNLIASGNNLDSLRDILSGNLISSGNNLDSLRDILSGNLITTGSLLEGQIQNSDIDISSLQAATGALQDQKFDKAGGTLSGNVTPSSSGTLSLGTADFPFKSGFFEDLTVSNNTLYVGEIAITATDAGGLDFESASGTTFFKDVSIRNLTVTGTETIIDVDNLAIKDNKIILNSGESGAGISLVTGGIIIDRGTLPDADLLFNEANDRFEFNFPLALEGNLAVTANQTGTYADAGNLITTGQTLTSEINTVSGLIINNDGDITSLKTATGVLKTFTDDNAANLITTGQTLTTNINTVSANLVSTGSTVDDISGNLIATGQTLTSEVSIVSGLITDNDGDITALKTATGVLKTSTDANTSNLISTGNFLESEIAIVSGVAGGAVVDALSGNLITTGQTLQTQITSNDGDISTLTSNLITTGQTLTSEIAIVSGLTTGSSSDPDLSGKVDTLSGNLITTGQTLQTQITSNDTDITNLTSNVITTGQTLTSEIIIVSGIAEAHTDVTALSGNLITTGQTLTTDINAVSSNLITTGQTLQTQITSNDSDISNLTSNVITTGQTLTSEIAIVSGIAESHTDVAALSGKVDDISGNLITTGQTLQTQITSNDGDITSLTSNLITTGQTLTSEIAIVSGIATGGSAEDFAALSGDLITTGQTLQTQITSNDSDISTLTSNLISTGAVVDDISGNLITTGQTLQTQITSNDSDISTLTSNLISTGSVVDDVSGNLIATGQTLTTSINTNSSNLITTGQTLTSEIAIVSGIAEAHTDVSALSGKVDDISGNLITTGQTLTTNINTVSTNLITTGQTLTTSIDTVSSNLVSTGAIVDDVSGNLITTGQTLQTQITSNDGDITNLTSNLITTGQTLTSEIGTVSGLITDNDAEITALLAATGELKTDTNTNASNLVITGQTLTSEIAIVSGIAEAHTDVSALSGKVDDISGNLITTGQTLQTQITSNDTDISNLTANLISTGSIVDDISGNLITTGQTLQTQITSNDGDITNLTSNLITTGQTLTTEITTVSGLITDNDGDITALKAATGVLKTSTDDNTANLISTGAIVDDISGNLITSGQTLQTQITSNDSDISTLTSNVITTGQTLTTDIDSKINTVTANLITTGQTLTSELAIVSGIATGGSAEEFADLSGNLITTGQTLQTQITSNDSDISTLTSNLVATGSVVDDISGNLITTGQTLQTQITSNDSDISTLTSNLVTTGQTLTTNVNTVASNLVSTGSVVDDISGNLITTGQTLQTQITSNDGDISTLTTNLVTTGQTLTTDINTVSSNLVSTGSVVDDISGNLITTGQTLQTQITSNDTDITNLTSNLVTTGQTLTTDINTVSSNLVLTGSVVDDISGNLITTGQTLQTQITSNDGDITSLTSNLITTGQTLQTQITSNDSDIATLDSTTVKITTDQSVAGNKIFTDKVTINNLTVTGTEVIVDVENLAVRDNIIHINSGESGAGISRISGGITIDRGTAPSANILYNDANDRFELNFPLATEGNVVASAANLITTGQTLTTNINTVSTNLVSTGSVVDDISGNLITTGQTLQTQITANDADIATNVSNISSLTTNLVTTGQTLQTQITSNDSDISTLTSNLNTTNSNLVTTGQTLTTNINTVSTNLVSTGAIVDDISGNLITTGQTLQTQITSNDGDISTLTSNLVTTGQTLTTNINTVSSNLITTGQTLQTQITSNDTDITNLSSNLVTTGQTLTTNIDTVATNLVTTGQTLTSEIITVSGLIPPTVVDGAGVTGYTARWYDGNTLTTGALYDNGTNVGIGNASPGDFHSAGSRLVIGNGVSNQGMTLYAASDAASQINFADGSAGNASYRGIVSYDHSADKMNISTAATIRMSIDSSGQVGWRGSHTAEVGKLFATDTDNAAISATNELAIYVDNANVRAMHIDSLGNVGIGTTAPGRLLDVNQGSSSTFGFRIKGSVEPGITLETAGHSTWDIFSGGGGGAAYNGHLTFYRRAGSGNVIFQHGNVGIGTTAPAAKLDVTGDAIFRHNSDSPAGYAAGTDLAVFGSHNGTGTLFEVFTQGDVSRFKILGSGATTVNGALTGTSATFSGEVDIADGEFLDFGNGGLKIRTNANNAYITEGTSGKLAIQGQNIELSDASGTDTFAYFAKDGAATLYYDNAAKLATTSTGVTVTGALKTTTILDTNDSAGTNGQVLVSTGAAIDWKTLAEISGVDGSGTANYLSKWTDTDTIGNSSIFDNDSKVTIDVPVGIVAGSGSGTLTGRLQIGSTTSSANNSLVFWRGAKPTLAANQGAILYESSGMSDGEGMTFMSDKGYKFLDDAGTTEWVRIISDGNVGIGTNAPSVKLHVVGAVTVDGGGATQAANTNADDLVIRGDDNRGISIITGTNKDGRIVFSDTADTVVGGLRYDHSVPHMQLLTEGSVALTLGGSQSATFAGVIKGAAGSVGAPAIILNGDTDTGFYYSGANDMGVSVAGTLVGRFVSGSFKSGGTNGGWKLMTSSGAGSAALPVYSFEGDTDTGMYRDGANGLGFSTAGTARLTIASTGSITVDAVAGSGFVAYRDGTTLSGYVGSGLALAASPNNVNTDLVCRAVGKLAFLTNNSTTAKMTILTDGKVGIGTTAPANTLHVNGQTRLGSWAKIMHTGDSTQAGYIGSGSDLGYGDANDLCLRGTDSIKFTTNDGSSDAMTIDVNGKVGIGTNAPLRLLHLEATTNQPRLKINSTIAGNGSRTGASLDLGLNGSTSYPNLAGDKIGVLNFEGQGTDYTFVGAGIESNVIVGNSNRTAMSSDMRFLVMPAGQNGYREKMRITPDGSVGIGTTAPQNILHVNGPSDGTGYLKITDSVTGAGGGDGMRLGYNSGELRLQNFESTDIAFFLGTTERITFKSDGAVVINNSGGDGQLYFGGTSGSNRMYLARSGADSLLFNISAGSLRFGTTNIERMRIAADGNVGIGTNAPAHQLTLYQAAPELGFYDTQGSSRNWVIRTGDAAVGDFSIKQSNAAGGNPVSAGTGRFYINSSGIVGIGVVPETDWDSAHEAIQLGLTASLLSGGAATGWTQLMKNARYVGGGVYKYIITNPTSRYSQRNDGTHHFDVAASGTADAAISWTTALSIINNGNVGIGIAAPTQKLHVAGNMRLTGGFYDKDNSLGSAGQILTTNGSATYWSAAGSGTVSGSGTDNYVPRWNGTTALQNSAIFSSDSGSVGIGTATPGGTLQISDENGGQQMLLVRNYDTSNTGAFTGDYAAEIRSCYTTGAAKGALLVHTREGNDARPTMAISDVNGIFTTFVNGKVGIGTDVPDEKLEVYDGYLKITDAVPTMVFERQSDALKGYLTANVGYFQFSYNTKDGDGYIKMDVNSSGGSAITHEGNGYLRLGANSVSNQLVLAANGNVGIGQASPAAKLDVLGATGTVLRLDNEATAHAQNPHIELRAGPGGSVYGDNWIRFVDYSENKSWALGQDDDENIFSLTYKADKTAAPTSSPYLAIKEDGKVGIGTNAPAANLHVYRHSTSFVKIQNTSEFIGNTSGNAFRFYNYDTGGSSLWVSDGSTTSLIVKGGTGGSVGIGTNAPSVRLHVETSVADVLSKFINTDTTNGYGLLIKAGGSGSGRYIATFRDAANNTRMHLLADGKVGIGTTAPDAGRQLHVKTTGTVPLMVESTTTTAHINYKNSQGSSFLSFENNDWNFSSGNVGIGTTSPAAPLDVPRASDYKVIKLGDDITSHYVMTGNADHTLTLTCPSYFQAEIVITAHQTNGGTYNNLYIRGIWSNNDTSHHWDEIENVGSLTNSTFTITNGQNGATTNSGEWKIVHDYVSGTFVKFTVRITDFYGTHAYTIS